MGFRRCFLLTDSASTEVGSHEKNKTYQGNSMFDQEDELLLIKEVYA